MRAICESCGNDCIAKVVDNGIGSYEYWGSWGTDVRLAVESNCCDADCIDEKGNIITVDDVEEYEAAEKDYYMG